MNIKGVSHMSFFGYSNTPGTLDYLSCDELTTTNLSLIN